MSLPLFINVERDFGLMQTRWAEQLNPVIAQPMNAGQIIQKVALTTGANVINHRLGRRLQGWFIVRLRAAASVFDTQDANSTPDKTLLLTASAPAVVDLFVF